MSTHAFTVHFSPLSDGVCDVFACSELAEENGTFHCPELEPRVKRVFNRRELTFADVAEDSLQQLGTHLFEALFHDRVMVLYRLTVQLVGAKQLAVVIKMNPRSAGFDRLRKLPWEALYDPELDEHLSLKEGWNVVRYLTVPRKSRDGALEHSRPGILAVKVGFDEGEDRKCGEAHFRSIEAAFGSGQGITRACASLEEFAQILGNQGKKVNVIHLLAHGRIEASQGGEMYFPGSAEQGELVGGAKLAQIIKRYHPHPGQIRLIVLCICESADQAESGKHLYYSGLASALVAAGFENVIGMSHPVVIAEAGLFFQSFYREFLNDVSLRTCLGRARQRRELHNQMSLEWAKPILFSRAEYGLFLASNWPFFKKLWTLVALTSLYLSITIWSQMQGGDLGLPTIEKTRYAASVYGLALNTPLYVLLLLLTHYYARHSKGSAWYSRLPEFWGVTWDFAHPSTRWFQGGGLLLFFIIPAYFQGAFYNKFLSGRVYYYPKGCDVVEEEIVDKKSAMKRDLEMIVELLQERKVPPRNICHEQRTFSRIDHFKPGKVLMPGHGLWSAFSRSRDYVYAEHRIDYFPLFQPWLFTLFIMAVLFLLILTTGRIFATPVGGRP